MKISFIVLVLFIGYSSGLVVVSDISKFIKTNLSDSNSNKSLSSDLFNISILKDQNLKESIKLDDNEVFQTTGDKKKSLNERASIFVNQPFKTLRNQRYNLRTHNINKSFMISERLPLLDVILPSSVHRSSHKELFFPNAKNTGNPGYIPLKTEYFDRELINRHNNYKYTLQNAVQIDAQKKPAVKPYEKSVDQIINQNVIDLYSKLHRNNKKPQRKISYARPKINYNYVFPSPYPMHKSAYRVPSPHNPVNVLRSLITDSNVNLSPLDLNDEDDQLLERYIKETLEDFDLKDKVHKNDPKKCLKCRRCKSKGNGTKEKVVGIMDCKCKHIDKNPINSNYKQSVNP